MKEAVEALVEDVAPQGYDGIARRLPILPGQPCGASHGKNSLNGQLW